MNTIFSKVLVATLIVLIIAFALVAANAMAAVGAQLGGL